MSFDFTANDLTRLSTLRLGRRLNMSCSCPMMRWFIGSTPSATLSRYSRISERWFTRLFNAATLLVIEVESEPMELSFTSLRRCSTPTSSASRASMEVGLCWNACCVSVPSSLTSSTATYPFVGMPRSVGSTSMMTKAGFPLTAWRCTTWWMSRSMLRILGPVLYQPTTCSLALTFLNMANIVAR